jgi:hypothetical protein
MRPLCCLRFLEQLLLHDNNCPVCFWESAIPWSVNHSSLALTTPTAQKRQQEKVAQSTPPRSGKVVISQSMCHYFNHFPHRH